MDERIQTWLAAACADADRRGLPGLKPLLETLARSTQALRDAERHDNDPDGPPHRGRTSGS